MNTELENPEVGEEAEKPKLNLDIKVDEVSSCERHVTVTVSREDIDRYFSEKFDEIAPQAEVPGFRIGKAPRQLLENRFRKQVADQVKGSILMDSLAQISDEQDFSAISEPDFDFESIKVPDEGPLTYEFNIEVRPEFDMPKWKGLKLEQSDTKVDDKMIDSEIDNLLKSFADVVPVDEPAQLDDHIVVNLTSNCDGKELSTENEVSVQVKPKLSLSDAVIENFDKLMVGAKSGDHVETDVTISEYAANEEFRGKEVKLTFEVLDVKRIELGDREQIAKKIGAESLEALREYVKSSKEGQIEYEQRQHIRAQITEALTKDANWNLPPELLKKQAKREVDRAVIEMRSSGFTEAQILAQENFLRQNAMEKTASMLKEHFILERIAEDENIEETDEDFETEINRIAMQRNDSPRRIRAQIERNGQMDAVRNMIVEQKVIDMITEEADIKKAKPKAKKEKETSAIEFFAAGKDQADIPEAKYPEGAPTSLPEIKERD